MLRPPKGFVDLSTAYSSSKNTFCSVIGVVVDVMPPTVTRTGEHMFSFTLLDPSIGDAATYTYGLKCRFFKKDPSQLPKVEQWDVVLIRNIKMSEFSAQPIALANWETTHVVFPWATIPRFSVYQSDRRIPNRGLRGEPSKVSEEEQNYVVELNDQSGSTVDSLRAAQPFDAGPWNKQADVPMQPKKQRQSDSSFGRKFRQVKDLRHREFADIIGEVVKKFPEQYGCALYVTDYTENKDMFFYAPPEMPMEDEREGDEFGYTAQQRKGFPGPYGHLVLKVNTRDVHSGWAITNVNEGDTVLLKNVKMKIMEDGAKLEGDMWRDQDNPDKVNIQKSKHINQSAEVQALSERKERYWESRKNKAPPNGQGQAEGQKLSKKEKKRQKKARKAEASASESIDQAVSAAPDKKNLNKHIRCSNEQIPTMSIRDILDPENKRHTNTTPGPNGKTYIMPFIIAKYRARVRVIDYYPKSIEDFTIPQQSHDNDPDYDAMDIDLTPKQSWSFSLLLEDATTKATSNESPATLWANLHHSNAQYLFGNKVDDPSGDLRDSPALLASVKHQLSILWGNLEERGKGEAISNVPFECCLFEYGVQMDEDDPERASQPMGWLRMFGLFGTTID